MSKFNKIVYIGLTAAALALPFMAFALSTPSPVVGGTPITLAEIEDRIRQIAQFLIIVAVIIAVIMIIWGGVMWMAARGDEGMAKKAKATIWNGVIGALVVLAVGVILQTLAGLVTRSFFG